MINFTQHCSIIFISLGLCIGTASAHEHWIDMENFYPAVGETNKISICSGHSFPKTSFLLGKRLLNNLTIFMPDNNNTSFKTILNNKQLTTTCVIKIAGAVIASFSIKKPQDKEPLYQAKTIFICGDGNENKNQYKINKGLEIVPTGKLSQALKEGVLPLTLLSNGKRVSARLTILPEQGKSIMLSTTEKRPAKLKTTKSGRYLVTTSYKGKGCSLTFALK